MTMESEFRIQVCYLIYNIQDQGNVINIRSDIIKVYVTRILV